jgi:hypothetical protein
MMGMEKEKAESCQGNHCQGNGISLRSFFPIPLTIIPLTNFLEND